MLKELLKELNSRNPAVQQEAIRKARQLSSEELAQLVQLEASTYNRRLAWMFVSPTLGFFLLYFGMIASVMVYPWLGASAFVLILLTLLVSFLGVPLWLGLTLPKRARRNLVAIFTEVNDPVFVHTLLTLLASGRNDKRVNQHVAEALKRLLPQLRADQRYLFNYYHRQTLCSLLDTHAADRELMLAILKALEQIGNEEALPAVERFAVQVYARQDEDLKSATEECLLYLRQQATQAHHMHTLLRASAASDKPELLLRPALSVSDQVMPEELLRPTNSSAPMPETLSYSVTHQTVKPTEQLLLLQSSEENGNNGNDSPTG